MIIILAVTCMYTNKGDKYTVLLWLAERNNALKSRKQQTALLVVCYGDLKTTGG